MKVTAVIAEYNPFHNGHALQLKRMKEETKADYIVVVMGGDFTQRGNPAIVDKYTRTQMALMGGADLVVELPLYYAVGSAEFFASGSVALLDKLGVVDNLVFGSECGDINILNDIADILNNNKEELHNLIRTKMKEGLAYPTARVRAIEDSIPNSYEHVNAMQYSNNILGFEYIRAIKERKSKIVPETLLRVGSGYRDTTVTDTLSSALAIRESICANNSLSMVKDQLPDYSYQILEENFGKTLPVFNEDISSMLKYKLLLDSSKGYSDYVDISDDLSDKIYKNLNNYVSFDQFCNLLKSKDLTYARISRSLLHILLNIRKDTLNKYKENDFILYARMLGFKKDSTELLSEIKKNSSIPLISKLADAKKNLSPLAMEMLECDIQAAHIYDTIVTDKFHSATASEFSREIVRM